MIVVHHARCLLIGMTLLLAVGCDSPTEPTPNGDEPHLQLRYDGQPIGDIHVRLFGADESGELLQGSSDPSGNIFFADLPDREPSEYRVEMESVGDGGWILDPKTTQKAMQTIRLKPFAMSPQQQLELPRNSVRPLIKPRKR